MMQQTIRQQRVRLALGLLRWKATITSPNGLSNKLLDHTTYDIGNNLAHAVVTGDGFHSASADDLPGTSFTKQHVTFEAAGVIVDIEAVLTVNVPDIDSTVGFVLGHALGSLGGIPVHIADAIEDDAVRKRAAEQIRQVADIFFGSPFDSIFGGGGDMAEDPLFGARRS